MGCIWVSHRLLPYSTPQSTSGPPPQSIVYRCVLLDYVHICIIYICVYTNDEYGVCVRVHACLCVCVCMCVRMCQLCNSIGRRPKCTPSLPKNLDEPFEKKIVYVHICVFIYIYTYMYPYIHICICVYMNTYRERKDTSVELATRSRG